jgi:hypothetical protein
VAQVLGYLFYIMRFLRSSVALSLETLYSLLSNTPIVKEALAKGGETLSVYCSFHTLTVTLVPCRRHLHIGHLLQRNRCGFADSGGRAFGSYVSGSTSWWQSSHPVEQISSAALCRRHA